MDTRTARDGVTLEEVGYYRPVEAENQIQIQEDRVREWLSKGAGVSPTVKNLLNKKNIFLP